MERQKERPKRRRGPKSKITILLMAFLLVFLVGTTAVIIKGSKKETGSLVEINELSDKMYIENIKYITRKTGTAPFNAGTGIPAAGMDYSSDDNYVRTNDIVKYTLEAVIQPNTKAEGVDNESYFQGGKIKVKAILPNSEYFMWVEDAWMKNVTISEDGKELYAEYHVPENGEITAPGAQVLTFTMKSKGIASANANVGNPKFEIWMDGNKPDNVSAKGEKAVLNISDPLYVTGRPAFNVKLLADPYALVGGTIDGMNGKYGYFGLTVGMQQDVEELSDFRGIEFPQGDFTVNIKLDYKYRNLNDGGDYQSVSPSDSKGYGTINGTRFMAIRANGTRDEIFYGDSGREMGGMPGGRGENWCAVKDSGKISATLNGDMLSVTFRDYQYGEFPKAIWGNWTGIDYVKEGYFGAAIMELFMPYYDANSNISYDYTLTGNVESVTYHTKTIPNGVISSVNGILQDVNQGDNLASRAFSKRIEGYINCNIPIQTANKTPIWYIQNGAVSLGEVIEFKSDLQVTGGPYHGGAERIITWRSDVFELQKYDKDNTVILKASAERKEEYPIIYQYGVYNANPVSGLTTDEGIENVDFEQFTWYNTPEEARNHGKLAAIYVYDRNQIGNGTDITELYFKLKVTNHENYLNTTQMVRHKFRVYENADKSGDPALVAYPSEINNLRYKKTEYRDHAMVNNGSPHEWGNTLLIVPYEARVVTSVADKDSNGRPKKAYDVAEDYANIVITPKLSNNQKQTESDPYVDSVLVTDYLPNGLSYVYGSANKDPIRIEQDPATGITKIVWEYKGWQVNRAAPEYPQITFKTTIDATLVNNSEIENKVEIYTEKDTSDVEVRTSKYGMIIANLSGIQAIKKTTTPIVDINNNLEYQYRMYNSNEDVLTNVMTLDILPYNGDAYGSKFSGTARLKSITFDEGVRVYYTTVGVERLEEAGVVMDAAGNIDPSKIDLRKWREIPRGGAVDPNTTALVYVKDRLEAGRGADVSFVLETRGNEPGDMYISKVRITSNEFKSVVKSNQAVDMVRTRILEGKVWLDKNKDGLITTGEKYIEGIEVSIKQENGNAAMSVTGKEIKSTRTDKNGYYMFNGLAKGNYIVEFHVPEYYEMTRKLVGKIDAMNSKANEEISEKLISVTDVQEGLNQEINKTTPILRLSNINAGVIERDAVIVEIEKVDSETKNKIEKETKFGIYEYSKAKGKYEKTTKKLELKSNGKYTSGWLYRTEDNEGKYYIVEEKAPIGYGSEFEGEVRKKYEVVVTEKNKGKRIAVGNAENNGKTVLENIRVKGKITLNKLDKEANDKIAQGDASLDGAVYGLYAREDIIHPDGKTGVVYTRDSLVKTGITENGGTIVFDELYLGKYYIKEITPSEGYLLDKTVYEVELKYKDDKTPLIEKTITSKEQVKKQPFTFTKGFVKSNALLPGSTSSLQVLENAGFSVYQISELSKVKDGTIKADVDGNYNVNDIIKAYFNQETLTYDFRNEKKAVVYNENGENGKLTQIEGNKYEVSELFSDKTGKVSSPELPYGKYVVVETTVPDNYPNEYFMAEPIIVTIREDSREEKLPDEDVFAVINYPFNAKIKITKMDSETKKAILKVGAKYRIYNMDTNTYVTQIISYPEHVEIGTEEKPYGVNDKGELLTPETLPVGHYRLEEVAAPYGYVLQGYEKEEKEKVEFYIRKESDYEVDTEDDKLYVVVKVVQENDPQVGELKIVKEGEKVVENRVNNGFFSRIARALFGGEEEITYSYNKGKIEGAEFEIYVKETIYTPDNQRDEKGERIVNTYNGVRLEKDALVGRIRTNENGEAVISRLPLGKYYVKEVVAGEGYVLNKEIKEMEFTYQGEKVAVVYKDTGYLNERQKAEISILKVDEITGEPLEGAEFGLYKREGEEDKYKYVLIEKVVTNAGGSAKFSADIPHGRYYIKETKAPEGYELIESYQEVNFQYRDQEVAVVKFEREFRDDLIRTPNKTVDIGDGTKTEPGAILTYTINYRNKSSENEKIRITDGIPEGTKYVAGHATATVKGKDVLSKGLKVEEPEDGSEKTTIKWESEEFILKPNEKISVTFKVRVKTIEEGLEVDKVTNKAKVVHGENIDVERVKDSYKVKYYKDNIVTGEFLGEEEKEAELGSIIPWEEIERELFRPEGYKEGELQEEESARIVVKGEDDIVYIVYKKEENIPEETKDSYYVRYYKDSIDDRNILGEYRVEARLDSKIPWEKIDKNLLRPDKYKEGKLQEEISSNIVVKGDSDIVYILYLPEKTGIKDSYTVKYYKDDVETGEYLGEEKFEELLGERIEFEKVDTELKRPEGYSNGKLLEEISARMVVEGDSDIVYVVYKKLPHEDETNEVENPVKIPSKSVDVGNGTGVLEGEELTYTITYKNVTTGKERFIIKDSIPEGTKYVAGSMREKINGEEAKEKVERIELEEGAERGELVWKSKEGVELNPGDVISVRFTVRTKTREEGLEVDEITNKGKVYHGKGEVVTEEETNKVENPVKNPVKSVDVGNKKEVRVGETLTYTVRYKNRAGEVEKVEIRDEIPRGTKYVAGSMRAKIGEKDGIEAGRVEIEEVEDGAKKGILRWKCAKLEEGEEIEVTFKVEVLTEEEGLKVDEIRNIAEVEHTGLVSGKKIKDPTNEIENPVKEPEIPDVPDTSDINIWLYVAIVIIALSGICYAVITNKKDKNNKSTK